MRPIKHPVDEAAMTLVVLRTVYGERGRRAWVGQKPDYRMEMSIDSPFQKLYSEGE